MANYMYAKSHRKAHRRKHKANNNSLIADVFVLTTCAIVSLSPFFGIAFLMVKWITTID